MDLTAAINRISELSGQFNDPEILTIPHSNGTNKLTYVILRDEKGGMVPKDVTKDLEKFDPTPRRYSGEAIHQTLDSLIDHINRTKNSESTLWGSRLSNNESLKLTAVFNYDDRVNLEPSEDPQVAKLMEPRTPLPQHGDHRSEHKFPLSDEILAWKKADGQKLNLLNFALFLEDHIMDVLALPSFLTDQAEKPVSEVDIQLKDLMDKLEGNPCGPQKLMQLSKGLQVNEDNKAKTFIDRNTGEHSIGFESENQDAEGNKLVVPNMFLIAIPIFEGGEPYRIPVRLRYSVKGGLSWKLEPYQLDKYIKHAFAEACQQAANLTGLPLFFGQPEA